MTNDIVLKLSLESRALHSRLSRTCKKVVWIRGQYVKEMGVGAISKFDNLQTRSGSVGNKMQQHPPWRWKQCQIIAALIHACWRLYHNRNPVDSIHQTFWICSHIQGRRYLKSYIKEIDWRYEQDSSGTCQLIEFKMHLDTNQKMISVIIVLECLPNEMRTLVVEPLFACSTKMW